MEFFDQEYHACPASDGPGLSRTVLDELARSCQRVRPDMQEMAEGFLGDRAVERIRGKKHGLDFVSDQGRNAACLREVGMRAIG